MHRHCGSVRALVAAVAAAGFCLAPARAQHEHGHDDQPGQHAHGEVGKAKDFGEAIRRINDAMKMIDETLRAGKTDGVSDQANAVAALARQLGALALAKDSGVPREKVKDANKAGKELADAADALHEEADKGDLAKSKSLFVTMQDAAHDLDSFAPATYFCPMHCEGSKTYNAPGECPVCHMKLKKQTSEKFNVEVKPVGGVIAAGKPATLRFTLKDPRGAPVTDVEIVHEMPLHLLMVSKDLSWYAHEHPELQKDGTFVLTWTFPAAGEYTLFHDFTPKDVGMQVVPVVITVPGTAPAAVKLAADADRPKTVDGYTVSLDTGGPIKTGAATHMAYTISKDGKPVADLEPYLGAMGHLVIISEDLKSFVHSHPHEEGPGHGAGGHDDKGGHGHAEPAKDAKGGPKVDFEARFETPGLYKGWAQFQHRGKVITVPFAFEVKKGGEGEMKGKPHGDDDHKGHGGDHGGGGGR